MIRRQRKIQVRLREKCKLAWWICDGRRRHGNLRL